MKLRTLIRAGAILGVGLWLADATAPAARAEEAKELYAKHCNSCHGPGGKGDGPAGKMLKPAPGDFSVVLKGKAAADIAKMIKEGGKALGKSALMPAFGSKLSDEQIQSIVEYAKGLTAK